MKFYMTLVCILIAFLLPDKAEASRFWLINTGSNGMNDGNTGTAFQGNQGTLNFLRLSAGFSLKFTLEPSPLDTTLHSNMLQTSQKFTDDTKTSYLLKTGINLNDSIPNLSLQLGGVYVLEKVINFASGRMTGAHWQQGNKDTPIVPVSYAGLLYRLNSISVTAGYNIGKGVEVGIVWRW